MFRRSSSFRCLNLASSSSSSSSSLLEAARSSINNNQPDDALTILDQVKKSSPSTHSVDLLRALAFAQKNELFAARQSALEELRHHPSSIDAQDLARSLRQKLPFLTLPFDLRQSEPTFAMCYDALLDHTMLDSERLLSLWKSTHEIISLSSSSSSLGAGRDHENDNNDDDEYLIVECGTAGGGSLMMMGCSAKDALFQNSHRNKERQQSSKKSKLKLVAFDTFSGMPSPTAKDKLVSSSTSSAQTSHWAEGTCSSGGTEDRIKMLARAFSLEENLITVPGLFQETLPKYFENSDSSEQKQHNHREMINMLHIDCDWYESTKLCLEHLWPRLQVGGKFQIDDFLYWDGCKEAVQEFFSKLKVQPKCSLTSVALCGTKMG